MALTVTGASAESYPDLAYAKAYADDHFLGTDKTAWDGATDPELEAALRQSTQYIDANFRDRFPGRIRSTSQALEWPRSGAQDRSGRTLNDVPDIVKNATVELAKDRIVAGGDLVEPEERGGQVKREKVDVLEIEYMDGAPAGTYYRWAEQLLSLVLTSAGRRVKRV